MKNWLKDNMPLVLFVLTIFTVVFLVIMLLINVPCTNY